ncbi:hypothetical protein [Azospirillum oryzae]|uniref:hypothetical protein n=1 Tax=Azospirillum oryzae TaxID=286727 RepID=UPI001177A155|nr:hypothetical protein [Azospirillum oryzae]
MGTAIRPASTTPASWDAFSDADAFVEGVLVELTAMASDGTRPARNGPKDPLTGAALRKAILAIWCVCFCGMQWRAIGQLTGIPFGRLYTLRPAAPDVASGLRRYRGTEHGGDRQPDLPLGPELLGARRGRG